MEQHSVGILYKRYEWISNHLEREAYQKQMQGRSKPLARFIPCNKALVFTSAMGIAEGVITGIVIPDAARTICACHNALSEKDLWALYDQATKEFPQTGRIE